MAESIPSPLPPLPPQNPLPPIPPPLHVDAVTIFKGPVSHWMAFGSYCAGIFVLLLGVTAVIFASVYHNHDFGKGINLSKIGLIGGIALIAASAIMIFYIMLSIKANRYTITSRLIERETGILVRKVDALDLGRVKHVDMKQSFLERVINVGTIEVFSGDNEEAQLLIEDIPDPRPVYEKLRDAVIDLSRRRGVILE